MEFCLNRSGEAVVLPDAVLELARDHASSVANPNELVTLACAVAICPPSDGVVVEIGTYQGRTACFLGRLLRLLGRTAPVLSIDAFDLLEEQQGNVRGNHAEYQKNVSAYHLERICMALSGLSDAAARLVPERVSVLVVDGGHTYEVVGRDLALYAHKVVPGGVIFIDDYSPAFPGVVRAADEFLQDRADVEVLHRTRNLLVRRLR